MTGENNRGGISANSSAVPPFWIRSIDDHKRSIDPRVYELAQRMWPWAFRYVEKELHDGPSAAETLEQVVIEVSSRLRIAPEVGRNLNGYLITAFHRHVRARRIRDSRIVFEGLARELERNHELKGGDMSPALEWRLTLDMLMAFLPHEIRHTLHLRMLGFSWSEVGDFLGISAKQAKSRYYYGVRKGYDDLMSMQLPTFDL
jgi:DNA-directed RNA polymerase specialized sigma24 family protein